MSRIKVLLAGVVVTAIVGLGTQAQAQKVKVMFAGSSAQWQTLALGTYNNGACVKGAVAPCSHYTAGSFNLTDTRPARVGLTSNVDTGGMWIVWDSANPPNVWGFIKVDSGVGNRCYFANPACNVGANPFPSAANSITVWPDGSTDKTPPSSVQALFTGGTVSVNVAATDIRPEDSLWSTCRTNSLLGSGSVGGGDGTDGLGYNNNNAPGVCPAFGANKNALVGNAIQSGYPGSTSTANVLAFALSGKDPFTGSTVPKYTTYSVGVDPIVFVYSRNGGQLSGLTDVTDSEAQTAFSGNKCDASAFGLSNAGIAVYLREPLSGTMNTTEASVFRRPVVGGGVLGISQENKVQGANPLTGSSVGCPSSDGNGGRWRGIGTGEVIKSVLNSVHNNGVDGITYTFFSYGNVSSIASSGSYGYTTLDGTDGIFSTYYNGGGTAFDAGQPTAYGPGGIPGAKDTPCGSFPCPETEIWAGGLSFPNVRSGAYRAWSLLRVVSTGAALAAAEAVIKDSQSYVITTTPDYIPALPVKNIIINGSKFTDPGITILRSHYQQVDGSGAAIGKAPVNTGKTEAGGDMGGCIQPSASLALQLVQSAPAGCAVR
ncbi:MAG: hypothetical protein WA213_09115 [Terriglobales bacterium]